MPTLAAVVVVSLAVGIGINTAVFSWIQAMVLQPIAGVADASGFYLVEPRAETGSNPGASWLEYRDLRERLHAFEDLLAFRMAPFYVGEPGRTERVYGQLVSGNYFSTLGLTPSRGRFIRPEEAARPGGDPVVVVSYGFWQSRLGGAPDAIGRSLRVNDRALTVIGVAPPRFQGTVLAVNLDLWVPATMAAGLFGGSTELEDRSLRGYSVMGRLARGATLARARGEVDATMRQLAREYPRTNETMAGEVLPFWMAPRGPQRMLARALMILQGVMLLLLLAVCGNTANLMLARASARQREMGMRLALGAGRMRILSLLLSESGLLALGGVGLGAALAVWATDALRAVPVIGAVPIRFQTQIDVVTLTFAVALGLACALLVGIAPAAQLAYVDPQTALRSGSRSAGRSALRSALMGVEVALALVVLMAAALFVRSLSETREIDPGFTREGVLLAAYDLTGRNVDTGTARDFAARLLARLRALPGVEAAAIASAVPLDIHGMPLRSFIVEGLARSQAAPPQALTNVVTPGYFSVMSIPFRAGTDFAELTDRSAPAQAVVNEEFVRRFLGGTEPIGRRVLNRDRQYVIVGVVRTTLNESFGERPSPMVYLSYRDRPSTLGQIHLRTRPGAEALLAPQVEMLVRDLDPTLPIYDVRTLADHVEKNLFLRRIPARMFVVLGPLLLALASIGIYAVVSYTVSRRTTEIGVRLALGATRGRVVAEIVAESLRTIGTGAIVGWALMVLVAMHLLRGAIDLPVFVGVPVVLLLVGAAASWLPAHRAAHVDPMLALRQE